MVLKSESVTHHTNKGQGLFQQSDNGAVAYRDPLRGIYISSVEWQLINGVVSFGGSHFSPC